MTLSFRTCLIIVTAYSCILLDVLFARHLARDAWIPDYTVFWTAARFALTHPEVLYDTEIITRAQNWIGSGTGPRPWAYPPSALLPLMPFAAMPFWVSYFVFTGLTMGAYMVSVVKFLEPKCLLGTALVFISAPVFLRNLLDK